MGKSDIPWTDFSWSPMTGCTPCGIGCARCFAKSIATRFKGTKAWPNGFAVTLHPERLDQPYHWKKPRRVFVCPTGDLFHDEVPNSFINEVWMVICKNSQHIFQLLTKRPERLLEWTKRKATVMGWPVEEVWPEWCWIGVTAENQEMADKRIPVLLQVPAAVRFGSCEPLLGPVDLSKYFGYSDYCPAHDYGDPGYPPVECAYCIHYPGLNWVIAGCESGPNRRHADIDWFRDLRDQCIESGTPFFLKQMEVDGRLASMPELDGQVWAQYPCVQRSAESA
jgi:protein gp37